MDEKTTNAYSRGKIYKLTCNDLVYYGSTIQTLSKRFGSHQSEYLKWKSGNHHFLSSFKLFEEGIPLITLVEDYPCERKEQLLARERWYVDNYENVNHHRPIISKEERNEYCKEYNERYRDKNPEKLRSLYKTYYDTHKDEINKRYTCICGKTLSNNNKVRHEKGIDHQEFIINAHHKN